MIDIFPDELLFPDMLDGAIEFLTKLDVPLRTKKEALIAWCKFFSIELTRAIVKELLGDDIDRV